MLSFGTLKSSIFFGLLLVSQAVLGDQYMPGQTGLPEIELKEGSSTQSAYFPGGSTEEPATEASSISSALPDGYKGDDQIAKKTQQNELKGAGQLPPGYFEGSPAYIEYDKKEMFNKIENNGSSAFSFAYIRDAYSISDSKGIYSKTFENATGSQEGGSLHLNWDNYFYRNWVNLAWGLNFGFGYNQGRGIFIDGTESDTIFKLWTVPVDLSLSMEIPVGTFFKVAVTGGPSAMGLYQSRTDYAQNERGKRRRQVGFGYFAGAKLKLSISRMMIDDAISMFSESKISNMFFNLEARYQNYDNFQDQITISGASFGVGFTFEYF